MDINEIRKSLNKKFGNEVAFNLNDKNPSEVLGFIPTGSTWLDYILAKGRPGGWVIGHANELAGLESTGKSYLAAMAAVNAQKMGIIPVWFDSENSLDPQFLKDMGMDLGNFLYVQATSCESVFETMETLLGQAVDGKRFFFIWDSVSNTPSLSDVEGGFNPNDTVGVKPRVISRAIQKLTIPLANTQSTLLFLSQLKINIGADQKYSQDYERYSTSGGKALAYYYHQRVWLSPRRGKDSWVYDDNDYKIGSELAVTIQKSRMGCVGRKCSFKVLWSGDTVKICDEESWMEAIRTSDSLKQGGSWFTLIYADGSEEKFQTKDFIEKVKDQKFRARVLELMKEELIDKFVNRTLSAKDVYALPGDEEETAKEILTEETN